MLSVTPTNWHLAVFEFIVGPLVVLVVAWWARYMAKKAKQISDHISAVPQIGQQVVALRTELDTRNALSDRRMEQITQALEAGNRRFDKTDGRISAVTLALSKVAQKVGAEVQLPDDVPPFYGAAFGGD